MTSEVTTVHSFTPPGGRNPLSELTQASDGFLYGATVAGGAADAGTIYRLDPASGAVSTIYSFDSSSGRNPRGALTQATDGHLYGATSAGGPYGSGTLFRILLNRAPVAVPQDVHASSELTSVLEVLRRRRRPIHPMVERVQRLPVHPGGSREKHPVRPDRSPVGVGASCGI